MARSAGQQPWQLADSQLSPPATHTCALDFRGELFCFGSDSSGQLRLPAMQYSAVVAGSFGDWTCGIDANGIPRCNGEWLFGDDHLKEASGSVLQLAGGSGFACGIGAADLRISCAFEDNPPARPADAGVVLSLNAGNRHACLQQSDYPFTLCWPRDSVRDLPAERFSSIASGNLFLCGISSDQTIQCYGSRSLSFPRLPYSAVAAYGTFACGITIPANNIICVGKMPWANMTQSTMTGPFLALSAGLDHVCGISAIDDSVRCAGACILGECSLPAAAYSSVDAHPDLCTCAVLKSTATIVRLSHHYLCVTPAELRRTRWSGDSLMAAKRSC